MIPHSWFKKQSKRTANQSTLKKKKKKFQMALLLYKNKSKTIRKNDETI